MFNIAIFYSATLTDELCFTVHKRRGGYCKSLIANSPRSPFAQCMKESQQNMVDAQFGLGQLYRWGWSVAKDYKQAVKWFLKVAEQGHAIAQNELGFIYCYGLGGVEIKPKEATKWFWLSVVQGHAWAQHNLGLAYYEGTQVAQNYKEAYIWYSLAAAKGRNPRAKKYKDIVAKELSQSELEKAKEEVKKRQLEIEKRKEQSK